MENIIFVLNIIFAVLLVISVLLQRSEGGALGIGQSQDSYVSSRSAGNFLTKFTAIVATLFIFSSISLTILSTSNLEPSRSVIDQPEEETDTSLPKIPTTNE